MARSILSDIPPSVPDEIIETLATGQSVRIERIISAGQCSPDGFWYAQDTHEWVMVLQGSATLRFDDGEIVQMTAGSYLNIPAHRKHRVDATSADPPTLWLAIHYS